ncbi:MAG: DUF2800 domain-containing protein [Acidiferrobacterales bacterium]
MAEHSPLGGSGVSRWVPCPGSVRLGYEVEDDDDEFSGLGIAAHELAAHCLLWGGDAWEMIGFWNIAAGGPQVDKDMADAVQVYLDYVRHFHPDRNQGNWWIERAFKCSDIHEYFYGTADSVFYDAEERTLFVDDYKHGAGVVVDVKNNGQLMYYACGALEDLQLWDNVDRVVLGIIQPRGFHFDGPIRRWSISVDDLLIWLEDELVPAMDTALWSTYTESGEHCRFCPVRGRACPQIMKDMEEIEQMLKLQEKDAARKLTVEETGRFLDLLEVAKIAGKQALKNGTGMSNAGHKVPGWKLAKARSNRIFKDGAEHAAREEFGEKYLTDPKLKSPAEMDKMPGGTDFTARWAFKPDKGTTLVRDSDSRMAVSKDTKSAFQAATKKRKVVKK